MVDRTTDTLCSAEYKASDIHVFSRMLQIRHVVANISPCTGDLLIIL